MGRRPAVILAPISREAALAEEEELNSTRHFPRVVPPSTKCYDRALARWRNFHIYKSEDPNGCLKRGEPLPLVGKLKQFMKWIFESSVGILEDNLTLKSMKIAWYMFRSAYQRETYNTILVDVRKDVLYYIDTVIREMGLSLARRRKLIADQLDTTHVTKFHPAVIEYTGMRAGSVVESSAYAGTNQALCYKDFELIGLRKPGGDGIELVLKVWFRYEKGNRGVGKDEPAGHVKWVTFYEDPSCRGRCPVTYFLAHAFADGVFEGLEKPSDLDGLRIGKHKHSMPFEIKQSKLNTPIFRRCEPDGSISEDRAMTYRDLSEQLGELGFRAGLRDLLRTYNIRRGNANAMDDDVTISANQYAQLLGHAVKTIGEFYISDISGIDVQGVVNR
ncbi:uncharacterized protein PAC_05626 [Phialocephala subalpina]|uniref:Ndc10 domain-containing protein n=1 Tax=Phialocephala subalpina TaxID=576137 RepID=A0A1L7WSJ4_9HELO|nr:uncharacterized protein PAC_05626 [Phialocephala subalpina]